MQGIGFIDIESVRQEHYFIHMHEVLQEAFKRRFQMQNDAGAQWDDIYEKEAAFTAEYGKIVSIAFGMLVMNTPNQGNFYVKTFTDRDERVVLEGFIDTITNGRVKPNWLCGHNLLEFDGPMIMRRCLALGIKIPSILDCMNKKPWDIPFFDTMAMYSGSAWKYKISQKVLAHMLGVPSSKDTIDGSKIANLYYSDGMEPDAEEAQKEMEKGLRLIGEYNASDVVCNARIFAQMRGHKPIKDEDIVYLKG